MRLTIRKLFSRNKSKLDFTTDWELPKMFSILSDTKQWLSEVDSHMSLFCDQIAVCTENQHWEYSFSELWPSEKANKQKNRNSINKQK